MIMTDASDRAEGLLVGLVAGDRIGGPRSMALCLARSLQQKGGFDAEDAGCRYLDWWRRDGFDTGPVAGEVLRLVESGTPFDQASAMVHEQFAGLTAGCNPAHRSAPLALQFSIPDERLPEVAKEEAALTHRHPLAGDVSAGVVVLCRLLIRGVSWDEALRRAADGKMGETRKALQSASPWTLTSDGFAPHVLQAAIAFLSIAKNFSQAMRGALDYAGPANYCPVLVGSIGGARWGRSAIADEWLVHSGLTAETVLSALAELCMSHSSVGERG
jgi:ADP-ribosyl-[dinitrogen reductase] hydrolase